MAYPHEKDVKNAFITEGTRITSCVEIRVPGKLSSSVRTVQEDMEILFLVE